MSPFLLLLLRLYLPIGAAVFIGIGISFGLSRLGLKHDLARQWHSLLPSYLGKFLFLIGVPISVVNFIRKADLSGAIWLAPIIAWGAIALGLLCTWLWLRINPERWSIRSRGSFTLVSIVGNTSYLGFPIVLLLPQLGPDYFGWALLYDVLGTFFGAYGLGVIVAARTNLQNQALLLRQHQAITDSSPPTETENESAAFSMTASPEELALASREGYSLWGITREVLKNPALLAFGVGLALRPVVFPDWLNLSLNGGAWIVIMLSLVLMGIRLQQLDTWNTIRPALGAVSIKMLIVPLLVAMLLTTFGMEGPPRLVLTLESAMPSAFAALVLAEGYNLDRDLVVTTLGVSSLVLVLMLPFWLWGFATW